MTISSRFGARAFRPNEREGRTIAHYGATLLQYLVVDERFRASRSFAGGPLAPPSRIALILAGGSVTPADKYLLSLIAQQKFHKLPRRCLICRILNDS